jgi:glycosyltransferase involved in cell wall biosynthesis
VEKPALAVVIPCCDQGEFLLDAVASVERALSIPYELIIVNDGSREPGTIEVLSQLRAAGYRVIDQGNEGLAKARNRGIAEASAPAFLPLDADNRLRAGFVEGALDRLSRDPRVAAVYGDRIEFGMRSGRIQVGVPDLNRLLCGNYIDACAVIRTAAWRTCGGYDAKMPVPGGEDWDLWLSMLSRDLVLVRLDLAAFDYRVRPDSMLSRYGLPSVQESTERYVLAKHAPLYLNHLRRQVDRLEASALALDEANAQLAEMRATLQAQPRHSRWQTLPVDRIS